MLSTKDPTRIEIRACVCVLGYLPINLQLLMVVCHSLHKLSSGGAEQRITGTALHQSWDEQHRQKDQHPRLSARTKPEMRYYLPSVLLMRICLKMKSLHSVCVHVHACVCARTSLRPVRIPWMRTCTSLSPPIHLYYQL